MRENWPSLTMWSIRPAVLWRYQPASLDDLTAQQIRQRTTRNVPDMKEGTLYIARLQEWYFPGLLLSPSEVRSMNPERLVRCGLQQESLIPSNTSRQNISGSSCCPWRSVPPLPCFIWHPQRKNSQQGVRSRGYSLAWCVGVDPTGQNAVRQISLRIKRYCKNPTVPEALVFAAWILRLSVHGSVLRTTVHGGNT